MLIFSEKLSLNVEMIFTKIHSGLIFFTMATSVAIAHLGLYSSDIGWGQWVNIVHKTVCRQWFRVG